MRTKASAARICTPEEIAEVEAELEAVIAGDPAAVTRAEIADNAARSAQRQEAGHE